MGYYTNYDLKWSGASSGSEVCPHCGGSGRITTDDVIQTFIETEPFLYGNSEPIKHSLEDSCKWYDHEEDMVRLSKKFPDVVFELHGEGEESGDIWVKYFKNGKKQVVKAELKFAPFDEKKLK